MNVYDMLNLPIDVAMFAAPALSIILGIDYVKNIITGGTNHDKK